MTTPIGTLTTAGTYTPLTSASSTSVDPVADPGLVQTAVDLSTNSAVISSFAGYQPGFQTYTPQGLLNSISQAGSAPATPMLVPPSGTDVQSVIQQSSDQQIVGTFTTAPSMSGIYTSSGTLQSLPSVDTSSNWSTVLKSAPDLSATVIADSFSQGIVSTLSTTA